MDGTFSDGAPIVTEPPGNCSPAHHAWLSAEAADRDANHAAYKRARADLSQEVCDQVFGLHDSAQHHFITMLLWEREGGLLSIDEAVKEALKHHTSVKKR